MIAVNDAFMWLKNFNYWVTLHPEKLRMWETMADMRRRPACPRFVPDLNDSDRSEVMKSEEYSPEWRRLSWDRGGGNSGSTGLFAISVAIHLGYGRVILAGVPMDSQPKLNQFTPWSDRERFLPAWNAAKVEMKERVRSMSGWTRELLGGPDMRWWTTD